MMRRVLPLLATLACECTLLQRMHAALLTRKGLLRWRRSRAGVYPSESRLRGALLLLPLHWHHSRASLTPLARLFLPCRKQPSVLVTSALAADAGGAATDKAKERALLQWGGGGSLSQAQAQSQALSGGFGGGSAAQGARVGCVRGGAGLHWPRKARAASMHASRDGPTHLSSGRGITTYGLPACVCLPALTSSRTAHRPQTCALLLLLCVLVPPAQAQAQSMSLGGQSMSQGELVTQPDVCRRPHLLHALACPSALTRALAMPLPSAPLLLQRKRRRRPCQAADLAGPAHRVSVMWRLVGRQ
jgi:hypothetical protein